MSVLSTFWGVAAFVGAVFLGAFYHRWSAGFAYRVSRRRVEEMGLGFDDESEIRGVVAVEIRKAMVREMPFVLLGFICLAALLFWPGASLFPTLGLFLLAIAGAGIGIQLDMLIGILAPSLNQRWADRG